MGIGAATLESYFLAALYWSLGATLVGESRTKFDSYVKRLASLTEVAGEGAVAGPGEIPIHNSTLYEYYFDPELSKWVPWVDKVPEYKHEPGRNFHEILVPTVDTVCNMWLLEVMVKVKRPVVLVGETGTSKTATTQNFLRQLDPDSTVSNGSKLGVTTKQWPIICILLDNHRSGFFCCKNIIFHSIVSLFYT
jgi:dynein heavy chain